MARESMDILELLHKRGMTETWTFCVRRWRFWSMGSWALRLLLRRERDTASVVPTESPSATDTAAGAGT